MTSYEATTRSSKAVRAAAALAGLSRCRHKHGAVVLRKGQVQGSSPNVFRQEVTDSTWRISHVHAEVAALRASGTRAKGSTLVVARINRSGEIMNSKPCPGCQRVIERAGVSRVVYTEGSTA